MNWDSLIHVRQEQLAHFIKNVAVLGGLVAMIVASGDAAGPHIDRLWPGLT